MGMKFTITESERQSIRGLYEQAIPPTQTPNNIDADINKLGLKPAQELKDQAGNVIGKQYMGFGPNQGQVVKIMNGTNVATINDVNGNIKEKIAVDQLHDELKQRMLSWTQSMINKPNAQQPQQNYMSDANVAKLNTAITPKQ